MRKLALILVAMLGMTSCTSYRYSVHYNVSLADVERPSVQQEQYSTPVIATVTEEGGVQKYSYEDQNITITWQILDQQFDFTLRNNSNHSAHILWDEVVYVDEFGNSGRVIHAGIKYVDKNQPMANTVVARGSMISDVIVPSDNIYMNNIYQGWLKRNLLRSFSDKEEVLINTAEKTIGKTMKIVMPIEIQGVVNEYVFTFKVNGYVPLWNVRN